MTETPAPAKPSVIYSINGKARVVRTSPRPYTFSYLAGEVVGGKGASAALRAELAKLGVADPEHTEWSVTLANGKAVSATFGDPPQASKPEPAQAPAKAAQRASKAPRKRTVAQATGTTRKARRTKETVAALRAEADAVKAWKDGGSQGDRPATPVGDAERDKIAAAEETRRAAQANGDGPPRPGAMKAIKAATGTRKPRGTRKAS